MGERRSKIHVLIDILKVMQRGGGMAKPTHILYKANLSHKLLKSHLGLLMEKGFVEKKEYGEKVHYSITQKGVEFIAEYRKVERLSSAFGLPI